MMVYPVPGRLVRDPVTRHVLTDEGLDVSEHDFFWARRLRDEDVTKTAPIKSETPAKVEPIETHGEGDQS